MDGFLSTIFRLAVDDAKKEGAGPRGPSCSWPWAATVAASWGRSPIWISWSSTTARWGPSSSGVTQGLLYTLWDLGLDGRATRCGACPTASPWRARISRRARPCRKRAYVVGDRRLFQRFRRVLAENVYRKDFGQFLETALTERDQRYRKFGGSPYMGEPNVKESAGGLRDLHTAMWLASTKFGARTLRDLLEKGLITQREERHDGRCPDLSLARAQRAALPRRATRTTCSRATSSRRSPSASATRATRSRSTSRSSCATTISTPASSTGCRAG